jgi:hypothetical protein
VRLLAARRFPHYLALAWLLLLLLLLLPQLFTRNTAFLVLHLARFLVWEPLHLSQGLARTRAVVSLGLLAFFLEL